jgi:hypothetical protein
MAGSRQWDFGLCLEKRLGRCVMRKWIKEFIRAVIPYGILRLHRQYNARIWISKFIQDVTPYGIADLCRRYNVPMKCAKIKQTVINKLIKPCIDEVPENGVLLIEVSQVHGEVLPGLAKYLIDLGYSVDVVMAASKRQSSIRRNESGIFSRFKNNRLRIFTEPDFAVSNLLYSNIIKKYKHIVINTYSYKIVQFEKNINPVCMIHSDGAIEHDNNRINKIISLVKMYCFDREPPVVVNSHYFGEISLHKKSTVTEFITFGNADAGRSRNTNLIVRICEYLAAKNITDYRIKIVGGTAFDVPNIYAQNIKPLGFLSFSELYKEVSESDFLLALIDPASIEYTNKASGSYQLCYGFIKPIIIHKKFSEAGNFTGENSILYENIYTAVEKAIAMGSSEYDIMVQNLSKLEKTIYETSLNNLKSVLDRS